MAAYQVMKDGMQSEFLHTLVHEHAIHVSGGFQCWHLLDSDRSECNSDYMSPLDPGLIFEMIVWT